MSGQLSQEILAVRVLGKAVQTALHQDVAGLQVPGLLRQRGVVVVTLPHVWRQTGRRLQEGPGLLHPSLPHLQHPEVVVALRVVVVGGEGKLKALVGEVHVTNAEGEMRHVVPDFGQNVLVLGDVKRALEARDCHIVLLGVKAAQTEVVIQLCCGDTHLENRFETLFDAIFSHLQQPSVISERELRLIRIEVIHADTSDGLNMCRVLCEDVLVIFCR